MLFEAWCGPAAASMVALPSLGLPPCGRPALRSLGCLCGSAARGDGVGVVRHETWRRRTPSRARFHAQRCPSGFVFVRGALPAGSLAGSRRTCLVA